jgi:hypothetical protein
MFKNLKEEVELCKNEFLKLNQPEIPRVRPFRVADGPPSKRGIDPRRNFHVEMNLRKALLAVSFFIFATGGFLHFKKNQFASYFQGFVERQIFL